jgi:hypothetical protein
MSKHSHFVIGASIGVGIQPTTVAVLEQEVVKNSRWPAETSALSLRHLERVPDASYPDVVKRIGKLLESKEVKDGEACGKTEIMLDITGSGYPVLDLFDRAGIKPRIISIGGVEEQESVVQKWQQWRLPKTELVGVLRVLFEDDKLKMSKELDLVPSLLDELRSFKYKPPPINESDPESWRDGQHDDLVFATAVAAWRAYKYVPLPDAIRRESARKRRQRYSRGTWQSWI